jgi:hypothetical protein
LFIRLECRDAHVKSCLDIRGQHSGVKGTPPGVTNARLTRGGTHPRQVRVFCHVGKQKNETLPHGMAAVKMNQGLVI